MRNKTSFLPRVLTSSLTLLALTGCACSDSHKTTTQNTNPNNHTNNNKEIAEVGIYSSNKNAPVEHAYAHIKSFKGDHIRGEVTFTKVAGGVKIIADIEGLTPGEHGFHIHENDDCSKEGVNTGDHYNPTQSKHGGPDSAERHVGDLGNIVADANGKAHYERLDKVIALEGINSIVGRSIVIHADRDDYTTPPTGSSGNKIACGVIGIAQPPSS
jgi:Cu-Zn family superoxide dismutase